MIIVGCPHCGWPLILPDRRLGIYHGCLNCGNAFDTAAAPVFSRRSESGRPTTDAPVSAPQGSAAPQDVLTGSRLQTRLTAAHRCQHCSEPLLWPIGQRRRNLECPHCARLTSVYAVVYHCPECDTLLESSLSQVGTTARCPVLTCNEQFTIPTDVLFNDAREQPDHTWFTFPCPGCRHDLLSRPADANRTAVCPICLQVLVIVAGGNAVARPHYGVPKDHP